MPDAAQKRLFRKLSPTTIFVALSVSGNEREYFWRPLCSTATGKLLCTHLRPDCQIEGPVSVVVVEQAVEVDDRLVAVLALQAELSGLVPAQDAVADLGVDRVGLVSVQGRDPAKNCQT